MPGKPFVRKKTSQIPEKPIGNPDLGRLRFLILTLTESFYGSEDPGLTGRLLGELPGILLWTLQGWKKLHDRGRFVTPDSSAESENMLIDSLSPVSAG